MPSQLVTTGLDALDARIKSLSQADFTPLLEEWEEILTEDNRQGLLAGLDGYGKPLKLGYRNLNRESRWASRIEGGRRVSFKMLGSDEGGDGPPLIPHWEQSRAIMNFRTAHGRDGTQWFAMGAWIDVISKQGVQFLPFHFRGEGHLPRRDLAHVRPGAVKLAGKALHDWARARLGGA